MEQYFEKSEEVILVSKTYPHLNGEYIVHRVITSSRYIDDFEGMSVSIMNFNEVGGISYHLENCVETTTEKPFYTIYHRWHQNALRKKHQKGDDFTTLMENAKKEQEVIV